MAVSKAESHRPATAAALAGYGGGSALVAFGAVFSVVALIKILQNVASATGADVGKATVILVLMVLLLLARVGAAGLVLLAGLSMMPGRRPAFRLALIGQAGVAVAAGVVLIASFALSSTNEGDVLAAGILFALGGILGLVAVAVYTGTPSTRVAAACAGALGAVLAMVATLLGSDSAPATLVGLALGYDVGVAILQGLAWLAVAGAAAWAATLAPDARRRLAVPLGVGGFLAAIAALILGILLLRSDLLNTAGAESGLFLAGGIFAFIGAIVLLIAGVAGLVAAVMAVVGVASTLTGPPTATRRPPPPPPTSRLIP